MSKKSGTLVSRAGLAMLAGMLIVALPCAAEQLTNDQLSVTVNAQDGSYQLGLPGGPPVLKARVGAQVDHQWLRSSFGSGASANSRPAPSLRRSLSLPCSFQ